MKKTNCPKNFMDSIKDNMKHALPEAFYIGLSYAAEHMAAGAGEPGNLHMENS